ncbi:MAG: response regulator transcription factor [Dehalococcoidales bacterium]|nr:response regulator transcription factor [Dehalococcoidales bacterium]
MLKKRILVVDDELNIIKFLRSNLEAGGFEVMAATDGAQAISTFEKESPDLVILDIMMPKVDGFEVCRRLREWTHTPIIMLSARADEGDKVKCLDLGADDYITKPFGAGELIARVNAVLRRGEVGSNQPARSSFTSGDLVINFAKRQVSVAGNEIKLTPTEYNLLQEFVLNAGKVLTHTYLLNKVWGPEYHDETEYLHVFARRLRLKLEHDPAAPRYLMTVPGVGYQFQSAHNDVI